MLKTLTALILGVYLAIVLYLTLVFHTSSHISRYSALNLVPFRSIAIFFHKGGSELVNNVPGNIVGFMPLGILLPALLGVRATVGRTVAAGTGLSVLIEVLQFCSGRRVADLDDVLLNTLGTALGYGLVVLWLRIRTQILATR